jgi:hypothetical protein
MGNNWVLWDSKRDMVSRGSWRMTKMILRKGQANIVANDIYKACEDDTTPYVQEKYMKHVMTNAQRTAHIQKERDLGYHAVNVPLSGLRAFRRK